MTICHSQAEVTCLWQNQNEGFSAEPEFIDLIMLLTIINLVLVFLHIENARAEGEAPPEAEF